MNELKIEGKKTIKLGEYQNKDWFAVYDSEDFLNMDWWYYGVDKSGKIEKVSAVAEIGVDEEDKDFLRFKEIEEKFGYFWGDK